MDVRNCKSCGRLFNYFGGQLFCPSCMTRLDEVFKQVKEYIYENPGAGVQEIAEEFEISVAIIHRWIREERLSFADNSDIGIECEGCGQSIKTGRFCKSCKDQLAHSLASVYGKKEEPERMKKATNTNSKMRFLN